MHPIHQKFIEQKGTVEALIGEPLSIDGLTGPLQIFQRVEGHRHSIDDAATAWYALQKYPTALTTLDLGTGIGTVGLSVLWGLPEEARLTCIEAQDRSFKILTANIECNGLNDRVTAVHGDIRALELNQKFQLVTGSPPYYIPGTGILPADSQKAHARFELRGNVGDYAEAAKKHLAEDGLFVFCFPFNQKERCIKLVTEVGFGIVSIQDFTPKRRNEPFFSLYSAKLNWQVATIIEPTFRVSNDNGVYTSQMREFQASRGWEPHRSTVNSAKRRQ